MQTKYISHTNPPSNVLQKALAIAGTVALAGVALMFSAVLLVVILIVGAVAGIFLWWKLRGIRRQLLAQMQNVSRRRATMEHEVFTGEVFEGEVIEGEAIRVDAKRDTP